MLPRERVRTAMALGTPDVVPVQSQMSVGHILLNSGIDPIAQATDTAAYAESLWRMRDRYDFDGILITKPARDPRFLEGCTRRECPDGWEFVYPEGCYVRAQRDDDCIFFPAPGFAWPEVEQLDPADPLGYFSGGYLQWHLWKGTHNYRRCEDIPESWYGVIDELLRRSQGRYSLHGETRAPFDHVLSLVSAENMMMALMTEPEKVHALMQWATQTAIAWSVAQIRRGCDAIKVSSPWVGGGLISPEHYRQFVVPYERELARAVRAAGGFVYTHTCGAISDRLEDMMDTEINGLECLDPPPLGNVDLPDAILRTKGRIFIKGNIDSVNTLLKKDAAGVREDVRRTVETAAPGGGYICSTACSIAPRVPPDNVRVMVEVAREFRYP
jgi:MtaA/CmuA family methyltransferase